MTKCVAAHGCITCGDAAIPMRIVDIDAARSLALCEASSGQRESVEIALVEPVTVGDRLLVHAGTALSQVAEPRTQIAAGRGVQPRTQVAAGRGVVAEPRAQVAIGRGVPA